jgi:hypothetical protein
MAMILEVMHELMHFKYLSYKPIIQKTSSANEVFAGIGQASRPCHRKRVPQTAERGLLPSGRTSTMMGNIGNAAAV